MYLFDDVCGIDAHGLITGRVRVEPVVAGVFPLHPSVIIRVLQQFGKIQDAIHVLCLAANPVVHVETGGFMEMTVVSGTLDWGDGAQINLHLPGFRLSYHSLNAFDKQACHRLAVAALGCSDIVDAFEDNHLLYTALHQDVTVEAFLG